MKTNSSSTAFEKISVQGRTIQYKLVRSKTAKQIRIKVRIDGLEVVIPSARNPEDGRAFVKKNQDWVAEQLDRARKLLQVRRPPKPVHGRILLKGSLVPVQVIHQENWHSHNRVAFDSLRIVITVGQKHRTSIDRTLERWLRQQARIAVAYYVTSLSDRLNKKPNRVFIMGQKTKWANCSKLANLSFNWRLIMAPDFVLKYIVTHEMVHLVVPDHSRKFWLTVQSLCPESEKARQWLIANQEQLRVDLREVVN